MIQSGVQLMALSEKNQSAKYIEHSTFCVKRNNWKNTCFWLIFFAKETLEGYTRKGEDGENGMGGDRRMSDRNSLQPSHRRFEHQNK